MDSTCTLFSSAIPSTSCGSFHDVDSSSTATEVTFTLDYPAGSNHFSLSNNAANEDFLGLPSSTKDNPSSELFFQGSRLAPPSPIASSAVEIFADLNMEDLFHPGYTPTPQTYQETSGPSFPLPTAPVQMQPRCSPQIAALACVICGEIFNSDAELELHHTSHTQRELAHALASLTKTATSNGTSPFLLPTPLTPPMPSPSPTPPPVQQQVEAVSTNKSLFEKNGNTLLLPGGVRISRIPASSEAFPKSKQAAVETKPKEQPSNGLSAFGSTAKQPTGNNGEFYLTGVCVR